MPAADIQRLLEEKPAIAGIAAPGMPMGSPSMEQGGMKQPYDVILTQPGVAIGRAEQAGADVSLANGSGQTALMFAALMSFPPSAFDFLPYA